MASDDVYEDGEILEEGQEVEQPSMPAQPSASVSAALQPSALLPTPSANPLKRPHSTMQDSNASSVYDTRPPLTHRQPARYSSNPSTANGATPAYQDDRAYNEDLVVKHPRQQPRSRVLLDFAAWMAAARNRKRLDVEDVQKIVLNVLCGGSKREKGRVSPYLLPSLMPDAELPTKVCVLLLGKMHPSVLQKYRAKLGFFDACSSVPLMLTKQELNQIRRSEAPLPELLYKFPRPTVDTHELSTEELFYAHELTFLMKHSAGFTDELVLLPAGTFTRKAQPLGGAWQLDGDLLHLKWRQRAARAASAEETPTDQDNAMEEEGDGAYTLDVLVSQDGSMHEFRTDPLTDETYAHKVPEHLAKRRRGDDKPRSIWLSLAKAIAVDVPRSADGALILHDEAQANGSSKQQQDSRSTSTNGNDAKEEKPLKKEDFAYYTLSLEEMKQHGYPLDVEEEQRQLLASTEGNTRDHYVKTKPRSTSNDSATVSLSNDEDGEEEKEGEAMETEETTTTTSAGGDFIYALDCEMCETDIGMELTRVTVVDIKGAVVYDQLVKPQSAIINYHTEFSGISEETLRDTKYMLADVQRDLVTRFLFEDTILVGHSLTSDLRAMRLVHPMVADTAILYPHQRGFPFRTSLKLLTKTYLKKDIQTLIQAGHDSAEDAIASLELLLLKVRKGPWFGIPEAGSSSGAFDSIVDKVFALDKKMTMLRLQNAETSDEQTESAPLAARKPWDLYASGDFMSDSQSPFLHAQAVKAKADTSASSSASAILKVENCSSWEVLKTNLQDALNGQASEEAEHPDLCWVEIEPPSASAASCNDFVGKHEAWMAKQQRYCEQVDAFLQQVRDEVLPKGTLLVAVPQGDLSLLRYLKGLRTRSKWRDATASSDDLAPEELHAAVGDAFRGAMDSCVFLMHKGSMVKATVDNPAALPRETFKAKHTDDQLSSHEEVEDEGEETQVAELEAPGADNETFTDNQLLEDDATDASLDGTSALKLAVLDGHYSVVLALLDGGAAVNILDSKGQTPLMLAAQQGRTDMVSLLLTRKASANYRSCTGATALWLSCESGELAVVQDLLCSGASADLADDEGVTPLMVAAREGYIEVTQLLLRWNANVNRASLSGETALTLACDIEHLDVMRALLAAGADADVADAIEWTPLMRAAQKGRVEVIQVMLDELVNIHRHPSNATTHRAGLETYTQLQQQRQVAINRQGPKGATALWIAAEHGQAEVVRVLLNAGASSEIADATGATPLMIAAHEGHISSVKLLLGRGVDIDKQREDGSTALEISARAGHVDIVRVLLNGGASVAHDDGEGWTPLTRAAQGGHAEVVQLLLDYGATIDCQDHNGGTALRIAALNEHLEVVRLLLESGAAMDLPDNTGWTPLLAAVFENNADIVQALLDRDAAVEAQVHNGATALIVAAEYGYVRIVRALLSARAFVDATDDEGWTALMCAAHEGRADIVQLLLTAGSLIDVHNLGGFSALVIAVGHRHVEVIRLLLEHGADIHWHDYASGSTLLSVASGSGEVVQVIQHRNHLRRH